MLSHASLSPQATRGGRQRPSRRLGTALGGGVLVGPGAILGSGTVAGGAAPGDFAGWSTRMGFAEDGARVDDGRVEGMEAVDAGATFWSGASAG